MNILYIAHRIPYPPNKGDKIRSFHQVRHLSKKHSVHLACLVDELEDLQYIKALEEYCVSVDAIYRNKAINKYRSFLAFSTNRPLSVFSFYSKRLRNRIEKRLHSEKIDRIIVFSSAMAEYVKHVNNIPKIMDFVDVDSDKWQLYAETHRFPFSWIYRLEGRRLARYEEEIARTFNHSIFVTDKEAEIFKQRVNDRPISVIPNGVDLEYFSPQFQQASDISTQRSPLNTERSPLGSHLPTSDPQPSAPILVFTGAMDYFPNVDAVKYFCKEIFPHVRNEMPEAKFMIVGRNPTRPVKELGSQQNVFVTGSVSDIRPYLERARVAVAPFQISRGIPNKILEAMAMGLPVVGTSTAFQGTQAKETDGIRVADDPNTFTKQLCSLIKDPHLQRQCSTEARRYVERYHRWEDHCSKLESLLQEMS